MGKKKKRRQQDIAWIQTYMNRKALRKRPAIQAWLSELRSCYVAGAHAEVQLLAQQVVYSYLEEMFFRDAGGARALDLMVEREKRLPCNVEDCIVYTSEVPYLNSNRSDALHQFLDGVAFLARGQNEAEAKASDKQARVILQQVKCILKGK